MSTVEAAARDRITMIAGCPVRVGAPTQLLEDKIALLRRYNLIQRPLRPAGRNILLVLLCLYGGFAFRIAEMLGMGSLQTIDVVPFGKWWRGESFHTEDVAKINNLHAIVSILLFQVLMPVVHLLSWCTEDEDTIAWQFGLFLFIFLNSISNTFMMGHSFSLVGGKDVSLRVMKNPSNLTEVTNSSCSIKGTCFHSGASYFLHIFLFFLLVIFSLRLLRSTKLAEYLEKVRCIGPALPLISSTRSRDTVSVVVLLFTIGECVSGWVRYATISGVRFLDNSGQPTHPYLLALQLAANMLPLLGFWGLWEIFIEYHNKYSHGESISQSAQLEEEIKELVTKHSELLKQETQPSRTLYCPITVGNILVNSGQYEDLSDGDLSPHSI